MSDELPWFDFHEVPPVGLRYRYRKRFLTLTGVMPYTRKDGVKSVILNWRCDTGETGTTGMKSKDIIWSNPDAKKSEKAREQAGGRNA